MSYMSIRALYYKSAFSSVNQLPAFPHYHKPDQDKPVTDEMDDRHHRQAASEECQPEMSAGMGERIQYRISAAEHSCENIDSKGKAVHLRKQGHKKSESYTHGAPLPLFDRCKVTQEKEGKQNDIDN